ncbi:MAG: Phage terminase, PBSX family large subunit [Candidatus Tokpelaia hoelldobleri]|uniref:Phage terminase, PBSX family large subunit n=1 Tax=Candidatus Tokpelaia hoelldobleri TaxID=1902579 RepID=A0A1U9JSF7_9HYPH|nr:MAG: Phage terminase, PBSX family large subunit [Candidatus Tokpelaia hoelldoblerii]
MTAGKSNSMVARIELPPKLIPVFAGEARYRGAYGGRGSGKTRTFAKMAAVRGYQLSQGGEEGLIVSAREYMNTIENSSLAELKAAIASEPWLAAHYDVGEKYIRTRDGRISFAFAGLRHNLDNIKSKARVRLVWVDEAEPVSETAWRKLIPTVREAGSGIWVTWNPESRGSATHKRFREKPPKGARIAALNWRDNPWFPPVLEQERRNDLENRPEHYAHIWEGDFVTAVEGAYYAKALAKAREDGRIGHVAADPLIHYRAFWDIGGTGAKADATAIWIAQFIGREIRVVDYYEAQGQPLAAHINWLRQNGYGSALAVLPHDGATHDRVHDVSFDSALREAGFEVQIVPNQGAGAARLRVEAVRRLFPAIWLDEKRCAAGIDALGWYHEKRDENRNIGLGPEHDWASHAADAFGLMAIAYEMPPVRQQQGRRYQGDGFKNTSWMAG